MALPKIEFPTFIVEVPSTKKTIKYRPFTVKEEKILLMAAQSGEEEDITNSIEQILQNCILTKIKIDDLTSYDVEYLFVNLRARSVNNIIELKFEDEEDKNIYEVSINIDDIKLKETERENIIKINDSISLVMKDPTYKTIKNLNIYKDMPEDQQMTSIICECIDKILVDDEVVLLRDHTRKEQEDFINSLSSKDMRQVEIYFQNMPKLFHEISYTRDDGKTITKSVEGLQAFFT